MNHELWANIVLVAPRIITLAVIGSALLGLAWWASLIAEDHDEFLFGHDAAEKVMHDDE